MRKILISILSLYAILFVSCIDEIDFDVPREFQNSTIIIGKIVKGNPSTVEITIQKIFDFSFEEEILTNAKTVKVVADDGSSILVPNFSAGRHKVTIDESSDFEVSFDKQYSLEVTLFDNKSYKSGFESITGVPEINGINKDLIEKTVFDFEGKEKIVNKLKYNINTSLTPANTSENVNLKWEFEHVFKQTDTERKSCYITGVPDFSLIQLADRKELTSEALANFDVFEQGITFLMTEGYYLTVIQESISDQVLGFWKQIKELSVSSGTFFEPPPGKLDTNFETVGETEGEVFGYFYGTQQDTTRIFIDSSFVNSQRTICPRPPGEDPDPPCDDCCDCLLAPNSTIFKPDFWTN